MEDYGAVIVSWDFSNGPDKNIAIVGRQKDGKVELINAFQGPEAYDLVEKLIIKRKE